MRSSSFDLVSPVYDKLAGLVFGKALQQAQVYFADKIPKESTILIIGGGSGWHLKELLDSNIGRQIIYLEASENMLELTQRLVKNHPFITKVLFRFGDEKAIKPEEKFDVIITNFFLDLFAPAPFVRISNILYNSIIPGGYWFVTDFVKPVGNIYRRVADQVLLKGMYSFFRVFAGISAKGLPDWNKNLLELNLKSEESSYFYHGLIKSTYFIK